MSSSSGGGEVIRAPREPVTVSTGVLSLSEWTELTPTQQQEIELVAQRLVARYGAAWLRQERERLRNELEFGYDVGLRDSLWRPALRPSPVTLRWSLRARRSQASRHIRR